MRKVSKESWRIIETIIFRYPQRKREYEQYISSIMAASGKDGGMSLSEEYEKPQSVTEAKAFKMTSAYADRMKKEIEAVEFVCRHIKEEEFEVIQTRYWTKGLQKPVPYCKIIRPGYSVRQMQRIVQKVVILVGRYLGEIK